MSKNRIFAILNWKKNRVENVQKEIIDKIPLRENDKIVLFCREKDYNQFFKQDDKHEVVLVSEEDGHNRAALLNFIYKYLKKKYSGFYGYTIYDSIQFKKDSTNFFDNIEEMMEKLHLDVWFNTYTDVMNFVFNKFDGRVSVAINEPELKQIYDKTIIWTSHSNPNVTLIDIDAFDIGKEEKVFDDRFEIPMFWIIKFLCERSRDKKGFMNHYPTISDEIGVYRAVNFGDGIKPTQELMQKEDAMFTELGLDHTPNQNVEALMDFIIERLKS